MNTLALITANGSGTASGITAVTLPGASGAADADMEIQVTSSSDIGIQQSVAGSTWSDSVALTPGARFLVPSGTSIRLKNTNAGTRNVFVCYRYLGSPS